jgi:hypothetical protein
MHPIQTINMLDIKVPDNVVLFSNFLNAAKDLAFEHKELFEKESIPTDIFHNEEVNYSGIQFSRYMGAASFTAIGKKEVKALELWFDLFKKKSELPVQNIQIIKEIYYPKIDEQLYSYSITDLLLKKELSEELKELKNKFARINRLEKYLYGNIKRFLFGHLEADINENDFISVRITGHKYAGKRPTYHGGSLSAFHIKFQTNVYLPQTLRLGQSTALGYGSTFHC